MFNKLKSKWNVSSTQLFLIICTFALGGSLCGRAGKLILDAAGMPKGALWVGSYILLISLLWPLSVLLVSIPLGQFRFFRNYVYKVGKRLKGKKH